MSTIDEDNQADSRLQAAAKLLSEGHAETALSLLLETWTAEPDNLDVAISYASLLARCGRETEAEELFSTLADDCPRDNRIWNNWGYLLLSRGEAERAIKKLELALDLESNDFEAMVNMGIALDKLQKPEEALAFYRKAQGINPNSPVLYNNIGAALWRSKRPEEAQEAFRRALDLNPRDASAANNLGIILLSSGKFREAEDSFRKALEIDPDSQAARKNLAVAAKQRKAAAGNTHTADEES